MQVELGCQWCLGSSECLRPGLAAYAQTGFCEHSVRAGAKRMAEQIHAASRTSTGEALRPALASFDTT